MSISIEKVKKTILGEWERGKEQSNERLETTRLAKRDLSGWPGNNQFSLN